MNYLPICLYVKDRVITVIGGGKVAHQKLRTLIKTQASIHVYAERVCDEIKSMPLAWTEKSYRSDQLDGAIMAYACTDISDMNRRIAVDARSKGILVNVADDPENCDFISPAIWCHENMAVAVSSDALDPKKSVNWRNAIQKFGEHDLVSR